jgi:maltose-binding protein MalE
MRRFFIIALFLVALTSIVLSKPEGRQQSANTESQELTFWGIYDLPDIYEPVIDAFQKKHPNIEVTYRQFPNSTEYHSVLMKQLERGKGPDIFLFPAERKAELLEYINPTNSKRADGFAALVEQDLIEDKLLYGLPLWMDSLMIYYNKRYYPDGIANAWYEFAEQTRDIKIGGVATGRLDDLSYGWDILRNLFLQKNVELAGQPSNAAFDTLEFFTRFAYPIDRYFNWSPKLNRDYPDNEVDSLAREKVAAIAGYAPVYDLLRLKNQQLIEEGLRRMEIDEIGVAPFPQLNADDPKYLAKYFALSVSIHSHIPNHAWDFIEILTDENHAGYYFDTTGRIPGRVISAKNTDNELKQVQIHQVEHSHVYPVSESAKLRIEQVVERGLKDKSLLREIFDGSL